MLQRIRQRSSALTTLLMLSLGISLFSQAVPGHRTVGHDVGCLLFTSGARDGMPAHLSAAPPSDADHPQHCLVCHLARAFRPLGPSVERNVIVHERQPFVRPAAPTTALVLLPSQLTLRSPPPTFTL